ncbi:hypothetical protein WJX73_001965 [Symbiochloris irregularis]|uniref:Uncharacterized protein n=1 Tax=Symbiochloris irregularis TaxID=706552 RepID=A0AAW1NVV4_9CHLO
MVVCTNVTRDGMLVARAQELYITGVAGNDYGNHAFGTANSQDFHVAGNLSTIALETLTELTNFAMGYVNISNTSLSGPLPEEFDSWQNILGLSLAVNKFTGTLPAWSNIGNGLKLSSLDISGQQLSGTIPRGWLESAMSVNLTLASRPEAYILTTSINAAGNRLTGPLPEHLGQTILSTSNVVERLYLDHNQLSSTIPSDLGNKFSNLVYLTLNDNNFSGTIPPELAAGFLNQSEVYDNPAESGANIQVYLQNNRLEGLVPPEFYQNSTTTGDPCLLPAIKPLP